MTQRLEICDLSLTGDEATEYMSLQLAMAARLFQNVPDTPEARDEVKRIVTAIADKNAADAALAFYDSIFAAFERMKKDD